jgi:hypothetical protein
MRIWSRVTQWIKVIVPLCSMPSLLVLKCLIFPTRRRC